MADKSKNFGNKVANFGKKFIGGLLFDDLPEASAVSKPDRLEYPFHDTQDYKSCIQFGLIDEEPVDLSALIGFSSIFGKNETVEGEEEVDGVTGATKKSTENGTDDIKNQEDAEDTKGEKSEFKPIIRKINESNPPLITTEGPVKLYLPQAIPFRDTASYDNADLGLGGAVVEAGPNAGQGLIRSLFEGTGRTLGSAFVGGMGSEQLGRLALTKLSVSKYLGGEGSQLAVKKAAGVTTNPNTRSLFKSVALREFAFQFKFIPLSEQEHDHVISIINFFRTELYPEDIIVNEGNDFSASVGFRFPNRFNIRILYNDVENPNTPRILPCYLRDVTTTYNPSDQAMHADGRFSEIDMSLAFTETRTLSKKDVIKEGY